MANFVFLLAFWLLLGGAVFFSWQAGSRDDRRLMVWIILAAAATATNHAVLVDRDAMVASAAIDVTLGWLALRYALSSQRHWPIWFTGMQIVVIVCDICGIIAPPTSGLRFDLIGGFWSVAALLAMASGLLADQRRGLNIISRQVGTR